LLATIFLFGCDVPAVYGTEKSQEGETIILRHDGSVHFAAWTDDSEIICEAEGEWTPVPDQSKRIRITIDNEIIYDTVEECAHLPESGVWTLGYGNSNLTIEGRPNYQRRGM